MPAAPMRKQLKCDLYTRHGFLQFAGSVPVHPATAPLAEKIVFVVDESERWSTTRKAPLFRGASLMQALINVVNHRGLVYAVRSRIEGDTIAAAFVYFTRYFFDGTLRMQVWESTSVKEERRCQEK